MTDVDPDTGLDVSGLIQKHVFDDADLAVFAHYQDEEAREYWLDDLRSAFSAALNEDRPDRAAALAYAALTYAYQPEAEFTLLNLQGIGLSVMIEQGGPAELHEYRIAAFEKALQMLPPDRGWDHEDVLCRMRLANAWREYGAIRRDAEMLGRARDEYEALLPALREGRWGYAMHAKAAEIAALLAQTAETIAGLGASSADPDPLPHWLLALELALDPTLREADTLGYWDAAMEPIEGWLDQLRYKPEAKEAGAAVRGVLMALDLPPDNPDHGWAQYHIGVFAMAVGLQTEGLRSEAKDEDDADALASAVTAYRQSLARTEARDAGNWPATAFQLAYSLHALGEARRNVSVLNEAIGLYEQVIARLAVASDQEDCLLLAQTQVNLSEAMAQKAEIEGDAALARRALGIAADAEVGFTLLAHDEGIEVAQANCARISDIIQAIENK